MARQLRIAYGQFSDKGRKSANQDFHGLCIPEGAALRHKGIAIALADGISSSEDGHIASESAVKGFLTDYYCTSETWSVKRSASAVLAATNAWLHSQTLRSQGRFDRNRGHVCTLSVLVLRGARAYLFHVGDARIYRLAGKALEQLTTDHRVVLSEEESYLGRAMGVELQVEIDHHTLPLEAGETFLLATDGVHEYLHADFVVQTLADMGDRLDEAAQALAHEALRRGSPDNLTVQLVRVEELPEPDALEHAHHIAGRVPPPRLAAGTVLDGYRVLRELHASDRSRLYLALDEATGQRLVIKTPSLESGDDAMALERLLMEEWIAQRIHNPHVLRPYPTTRPRSALYVTLEYLEGQSLAQWMADHPHPPLETVRGLLDQLSSGLLAFHRLEMVHQDLRPENILVDAQGTLTIIDFGATRIASVAESATPGGRLEMLGTLQYSAPEYLLGEESTSRSDIFSAGVIAYQMLSGALPYGAAAARIQAPAQARKLRYASLADRGGRHVPVPRWVDGALRKCVHPDPHQRYAEISEFAWDLRHPNTEFLGRHQLPLMARHPVLFWQGVALLLLVLLVLSLALKR